jgi:hypothetical protein
MSRAGGIREDPRHGPLPMRLHFPYKSLTAGTPTVPILRPAMRRLLLLLSLLALALPVAGLAAARGPADGTLSVAGARGKIVINARGALIGRFDRGSVAITDLTPNDPFSPIVVGGEERLRGDAVVYSGRDVRFRLIGGAYRIEIRANGVNLSAVGNGTVWLTGESSSDPGVFSFSEDCRTATDECEPLPAKQTRYQLGSRSDKLVPGNAQRPE